MICGFKLPLWLEQTSAAEEKVCSAAQDDANEAK
jgi:hypothetical protein